MYCIGGMPDIGVRYALLGLNALITRYIESRKHITTALFFAKYTQKQRRNNKGTKNESIQNTTCK
ncbi:hypothetical protein ALT1000_150045 [Alteromonas macleodii]